MLGCYVSVKAIRHQKTGDAEAIVVWSLLAQSKYEIEGVWKYDAFFHNNFLPCFSE